MAVEEELFPSSTQSFGDSISGYRDRLYKENPDAWRQYVIEGLRRARPATAGEKIQQIAHHFMPAAAEIPAAAAETAAIAGRHLTGEEVGAKAMEAWAQELRKTANDFIPEANHPKVREDLLLNDLPRGAFDAGFFLLGGPTARLAKLPNWIGMLTVAEVMNAAPTYHEIFEKTGDRDKALRAALKASAFIAPTEYAGIGRIWSKLDKASGGSFSKRLFSAASQGAEEVFQDWFAGEGLDIIYEHEGVVREEARSELERGGISFFVAAMYDLVLGSVPRKRFQQSRNVIESAGVSQPDSPLPGSPAPTEAPAPTTEDQIDLGDERSVALARARLEDDIQAVQEGQLAPPEGVTPEDRVTQLQEELAALPEVATKEDQPEPTTKEEWLQRAREGGDVPAEVIQRYPGFLEEAQAEPDKGEDIVPLHAGVAIDLGDIFTGEKKAKSPRTDSEDAPFELPQESIALKAHRLLEHNLIQLKVAEEQIKKAGGKVEESAYTALANVGQKQEAAAKKVVREYEEPILKEISGAKEMSYDQAGEHLEAIHAPQRNAVLQLRAYRDAVADKKLNTAQDKKANKAIDGAQVKIRTFRAEAMRDLQASEARFRREKTRAKGKEGAMKAAEAARAKRRNSIESRLAERTQKVEEGLEARLEDIGVQREVMIAKKAERPENFGSGLSEADAAAIIETNLSGVDAQRFRNIHTLSKKLVAAKLKAEVESGRLSKEEAARLTEMYPDYVPLKDAPEGEGIRKSTQRIGKGIQRAKGRTRRATSNPLNQLLQDSLESSMRSEENKARQKLLKLVLDNPHPDVWTVTEGRGTTYIDEHGEMRRGDPKLSQEEMDRTVNVWLDGQEYLITFNDPLIARAVKGMRPEWVKAITSIPLLNKWARWFSQIHTTFDPGFAFLRNPARDIQTAVGNLGLGPAKVKVKDILNPKRLARNRKAMLRHLRGKPGSKAEDKVIDEYVEDGALVDWGSWESLEERQARLMKEIKKERAPSKKGYISIKAMADLMRHHTTAIENTVRITFYEELRKAGVSRPEAALAAKELTVNFGKNGELTPALNILWVFSGANIKGSMNMARAILRTKSGKVMAAGLLSAGGFQDFLNALWGDDEYDELIPEWEKKRSWVMVLPKDFAPSKAMAKAFGWALKETPTGSVYLKLPLPWGYSIFHNIGRNMSATLRGAKEPAESAGDVAESFLEAFSPFGMAADFIGAATPTAARPFVESFRNLDYKGDKLAKIPYDQDSPKSHAYWNSTGEGFVNVAKFLNAVSGGDETDKGFIDFSPEMIEHWYRYATGGPGRFVSQAAQPTLEGKYGSLSDVPFVRDLIGGVSDKHHRFRYFGAASDFGEFDRRYLRYKRDDKKKFKDLSGTQRGLVNNRMALKREIKRIREMKEGPEQLRAMQEFSEAYEEAAE